MKRFDQAQHAHSLRFGIVVASCFLIVAATAGFGQGAMNIDSSGNVGIGTATPSSPLHVVGKNGSGVNTTVDGGSLVVTRGDSTPNIRFLKTAGTAQSWLFQNNSTSGVFAIRDETGGTSPVQIFPGAGAQLLQLQGTHVNVNGQIWQRGGVLHADYVFEPGFKLDSITAHAKYMWKHKHLPAIAGVQRDAQGREMVNLGAQQRGIVQELETAHIYIAELNSELAATKADLAAERQAHEKTQAEVSQLKAALQRLEKSLKK